MRQLKQILMVLVWSMLAAHSDSKKNKMQRKSWAPKICKQIVRTFEEDEIRRSLGKAQTCEQHWHSEYRGHVTNAVITVVHTFWAGALFRKSFQFVMS